MSKSKVWEHINNEKTIRYFTVKQEEMTSHSHHTSTYTKIFGDFITEPDARDNGSFSLIHVWDSTALLRMQYTYYVIESSSQGYDQY